MATNETPLYRCQRRCWWISGWWATTKELLNNNKYTDTVHFIGLIQKELAELKREVKKMKEKNNAT